MNSPTSIVVPLGTATATATGAATTAAATGAGVVATAAGGAGVATAAASCELTFYWNIARGVDPDVVHILDLKCFRIEESKFV